MTTARRRFANIRHDLRSELPNVFAEPALLGTWLQLHLAADSAWPNVAELPRIAHQEQVDRLVQMGDVCLSRDDHYLYRMPGLDRDRDGEVEAGRQNVMKRKDRRGEPPLPEPDYRPLMKAFHRDHVGATKPLLLQTDGRTDVTRRVGAAA